MPRIAFAALGSAVLIAGSAQGAIVQQVYVGTLSNSFNNASHPSGLTRGGKYVVRTSFDTDDMISIPAADRSRFSRDTHVVQLTGDPSASGATNTYELFLPSEGYGTTLTQTGQDHFFLGAGFATTAEIQFFDSCDSAAGCAAQFRGFEFESNFLRTNDPNNPAANSDLVFQQFTANVNFSGTDVTNYIVRVADENLNTVVTNAGHLDVLSESGAAAGGQLNPGVFFGEAVDVVAEAGAAPLVYSAGNLTVTTNAGTELVTDTVTPPTSGVLRSAPSSIDNPTRQADNDLGAGRSDGEDFLTFDWTVGGNSVTGNLTGTRLNRTVETLDVTNPSTEPHGPRFVNQGTRTVDDVNIAVAIQDSGLTSTTDTTTFGLSVSEDYTGKSDTDSVQVSYANALPSIDSAGVTDIAGGLLFELMVSDPDLAVNTLIADFESLSIAILVDAIDYSAFFDDLIDNGSQFVDAAALAAEFGPGTYQLAVSLRDRLLVATAGTPITTSFSFDVTDAPTGAPVPATAFLLASGVAGLAGARRRRRTR